MRPDTYGPDAVTAEMDKRLNRLGTRDAKRTRVCVIENHGYHLDTWLRITTVWDDDFLDSITQVDIYPDAVCQMRPLGEDLHEDDFTEQQWTDLQIAVMEHEFQKLRAARS